MVCFNIKFVYFLENLLIFAGGGQLLRIPEKVKNDNFSNKKTKKVKKKIFFSEKYFQSGKKICTLKSDPNLFFYNESDSKMVKNLYTKK